MVDSVIFPFMHMLCTDHIQPSFIYLCPSPFPTSINHYSIFRLTFLSDSSYKREHVVLVFLCLAYSISIHIAANGRVSFFMAE
jgi:hypothetical protein